MILQSKPPINSKQWLLEQQSRVWISINSIPSEIFHSVWEYIESKHCELMNNKLYFRIL